MSNNDKSKPFILDYEATVGCSIAVMKKAAKASVSGGGFRPILLSKKRRGRILEGGSGGNDVGPKVQKSSSWDSETGKTTEFESVDMEEECLVEETSFDYGKGGALAEGDYDQTPIGIRVKTKKALGKPLGKIDFSLDNDNDNILLDTPLALLTSIKKLVAVSVCKSFALDIGLDKITEKSSQEKLVVVRKLFSRINSFGGTSTFSKFAGIIQMTFTSESSLVKTTEMATDVKILVNTDLRKSSGHSDRAVVLKKIPVGTSAKTVRAALSDFSIIKSIKMQLVGLWQKAVVEFEQLDQADLVAAEWFILIKKDVVRVAKSDKDKEAWNKRDVYKALLYTLPVETNAHDIWNYIKSVGGKTYIINYYPVSYARARCTTVCFDFADSLNAVMGTTPVLRGANLHWSSLIMAKCAKCENSGYTFLDCVVGGKIPSSGLQRRIFSDSDKGRLTTIYAKCSASVARPVSFGGAF